MTTMTQVSHRTGLFDGFLATLRTAIARRSDIRRTVSQLNALSIRQREDLGIAGLDMNEVAHAAHGH